MKVICESGKFSIYKEENMLIINEWQGVTRNLSMKHLRISEIAGCLPWMDYSERNTLRIMIGKRRYKRAEKYAKELEWID